MAVKIINIQYDNNRLTFFLSDNRIVSIPIEEYRVITEKTKKNLDKYTISKNGSTVLWNEMELTISVDDLFNGKS